MLLKLSVICFLSIHVAAQGPMTYYGKSNVRNQNQASLGQIKDQQPSYNFYPNPNGANNIYAYPNNNRPMNSFPTSQTTPRPQASILQTNTINTTTGPPLVFSPNSKFSNVPFFTNLVDSRSSTNIGTPVSTSFTLATTLLPQSKIVVSSTKSNFVMGSNTSKANKNVKSTPKTTSSPNNPALSPQREPVNAIPQPDPIASPVNLSVSQPVTTQKPSDYTLNPKSEPTIGMNKSTANPQPVSTSNPISSTVYQSTPSREPFTPTLQPASTPGMYNPSINTQPGQTSTTSNSALYPSLSTFRPINPFVTTQPNLSGPYNPPLNTLPLPTQPPYNPYYPPGNPTTDPKPTLPSPVFPLLPPPTAPNREPSSPQPPGQNPLTPGSIYPAQPDGNLWPANPTPQPPAYADQTRPLLPTDTEQGNFQCSSGNGYYGFTDQCDTYLECQDNNVKQYVCPDGLHFNPKKAFPDYPCSYPSEVKCNGYRQTSRPTNECPQQYGFYSSSDGECSRYIMCQEGKATMMNCPLGLVFNEQLSACDWPANVPQCNPNAFRDFTCPKPTNIDNEPSNTIYKYRYGTQCKLYVACQQGYPRLLSCDTGLSFDERSQACINSENVEGCAVQNFRFG